MAKAKSKSSAKPKSKASEKSKSKSKPSKAAPVPADDIDIKDDDDTALDPALDIVDDEVAVDVPEVADAPDAVDGAAKRGRAVKEPPPPKNWRVEGLSPEGIRVILGRFVTREEAEPELDRIKEDGFYAKVRLVETTDASK